MLAQSKTIFAEALIHVVGAWPAGERHIRGHVGESVMDVIEDKVEDLRDMVRGVEGKLWRLGLENQRGERVSPGNGFADWLVVSLFRQWLADNTSPPPLSQSNPASSSQRTHGHGRASSLALTLDRNAPLPPSPAAYSQNQQTGRTMRLIGSSSNQAYLNHDECKKFLKGCPELYSREGLKRFEKRMDEVKGMAREVVRPLMRSFLEGDAGAGVGYLVCTRVEERDYVWL